MNDASKVLFDICHVIKNIRDTLEFARPQEVTVQAYEQRKTIAKTLRDPKTICGKFIDDNKDKLTDFLKRYDEFIEDVYGDSSSILTKTAEGKVRVDHAQDIRIVTDVVYITETLRDLLFQQFHAVRNANQLEKETEQLVDLDERVDRSVKSIMLLVSYQKSFQEFQKVMNETKGQPSPQSNFIVQNELQVLAGAMRFVRNHCHMIDNRSLDVYDQMIQLNEMCEGRRERRDNKSFPVLFNEVLTAVNNIITEVGPNYDKAYHGQLQEMLATLKQNNKENESNAA